MPTIIVENVPAEVYERLQQRAADRHRTVREEMLHLLQQVLNEGEKPSPRMLELIFHEEEMAPVDLPRSSKPIRVTAYNGSPRLPDFFLD